MKKVILGMALIVAMSISVGVNAKDNKTKKECSKTEQCDKKDAKACDKKSECTKDAEKKCCKEGAEKKKCPKASKGKK